MLWRTPRADSKVVVISSGCWSADAQELERSGEWFVGRLAESGGDAAVSCVPECVDREVAEGGQVAGLWPVWIFEAFSAKVVSRAWWSRFSMGRCDRASREIRCGEASAEVRSVIA